MVSHQLLVASGDISYESMSLLTPLEGMRLLLALNIPSLLITLRHHDASLTCLVLTPSMVHGYVPKVLDNADGY